MKLVLILIGLNALGACVGPLPAPTPPGQLSEAAGGVIYVDIPRPLHEVREFLESRESETAVSATEGVFLFFADDHVIRIEVNLISDKLTQLRIEDQRDDNELLGPNSLRLWSRDLVKDLLP